MSILIPTLEDLKTQAAKSVEKYAQYAGHFDNYKRVKMKKGIRTKMGILLPKNSFTIFNPITIDDRFGNKSVLVWSFLQNIDVTVECKDIEII